MGAKPPKKEQEKTAHSPSATNGSSHTPKEKHKSKEAAATSRLLLKIPLDPQAKNSCLNSANGLLDADAINREIIENAPDIIYMHDLQGNFTYANRAVTALLGYSPEEALALNIRDILAPEDLERARAAVASKLAGNKSGAPY